MKLARITRRCRRRSLNKRPSLLSFYRSHQATDAFVVFTAYAAEERRKIA
ncbi:hypothetical protein KCP77_08690 [Salmonella enterica subsp. enterica]|nr:hypothetical protein KCP77_08690 [Salmonella enterica subsp. enterica]